jgi:virginiamycin A acetyltransferase
MADPNLTFPRPADTTTVYLKNVIKRPQNVVGDFTIYNDPFHATEFETRNVLYQQTPYLGGLIIGKYCSIASGARFLFNSANHTLSSFSTYPFPLFGNEWESEVSPREAWDLKGDIVVGNDVWIGYEAVVLAGVQIGDGAIIGTRALVTKDVPPYSIVGGVPAKLLRQRFDSETITALLKIRWWDWPHELVRRNLDAIRHMRLEELKAVTVP